MWGGLYGQLFESITIASVLAVGVALWRIAYKVGRLERTIEFIEAAVKETKEKAEELWKFLLRRGKVEIVHAGYGQMDSPITLDVRALDLVMPFINEFLPFYVGLLKANPNITEEHMAFEIEKHFGDFIIERICIPGGVSASACLIAIMETCRKCLSETDHG